MNNKKETNEEENNQNLKINIKDNDNNEYNKQSTKNQENCPIINYLKTNKNNKKINNNYTSPKNSNNVDLRLPYMRLTRSTSNNIKINNLLNLERFFSDFNNVMEKKAREIIRDIASEYKDEKYDINKIIFRYGDEADRYFIIYDGEVSLYFPFTEIINMNIDEFFIYILRLRRYNEIEMLNAVLLLNNAEFMKGFDKGFLIDNYIYKLYTTYLKLIFDPTFLYHQEISKKRKINKINNNNKSNSNIINKNKTINSTTTNRIRINYYFEDNKEVDINIFDTFNDRDIKELLLRIGDELIETMKWIMPEKMYNIVEEKNEEIEEDIVKKKIVRIPEKLIEKYKGLNPNIVNEYDYYKRILPIKSPNNKLISKKIIVMKYLYIDTLKTGQSFGDFNPDSLSLFSHRYINIARNSLLGLKLHQHHHFRNMTAISTTNKNSTDIKNKLHLLSFNKKIYLKILLIKI